MGERGTDAIEQARKEIVGSYNCGCSYCERDLQTALDAYRTAILKHDPVVTALVDAVRAALPELHGEGAGHDCDDIHGRPGSCGYHMAVAKIDAAYREAVEEARQSASHGAAAVDQEGGV